jgi:hypothetical protein
VGFAREKPGETPYGSSRSFWKDVGLGFDLRKFGGLAVPSQTVAMDPGNVPGMFDWFARFSFQHGSWIGLQACQSTKMHIAYVVGHTSWTWHNKRQPQVTDRDLKNGKGQLRSWGVEEFRLTHVKTWFSRLGMLLSKSVKFQQISRTKTWRVRNCPPNWALSMQDPCLKVGQTCAGPRPDIPDTVPLCMQWPLDCQMALASASFRRWRGDKLNVGVAEFTIEARLRCTLGFVEVLSSLLGTATTKRMNTCDSCDNNICIYI